MPRKSKKLREAGGGKPLASPSPESVIEASKAGAGEAQPAAKIKSSQARRKKRLAQLKALFRPENRHQLLEVSGQIGKEAVKCLLDSGATHNVVSRVLLEKVHMDVKVIRRKFRGKAVMFDSSEVAVLNEVRIPIRLFQREMLVDCLVLDSDAISNGVVLGKPWLCEWNPTIDWATHTITVPPKPHIMTVRAFRRSQKLGEPVFLGMLKLTKEGPVLEVENWLERVQHSERFAEVLRQFADVFQPPPPGVHEKEVKHTIPLKAGAEIPKTTYYPLSPKGTQVLKEQLQVLLKNSWVRRSASAFGAPVLLVPKADGSFRLCVDYRALNRITEKCSYPLPRIDELLEKLGKAKVLSTLDLSRGYHQITVADEDIPKTAFRTRYGLFEWTVMPFGLSGAPSTFMRLMDQVFGDLLDDFVVVYLDDILVFSESEEEHEKHLQVVLERLRQFKLFAEPKKCKIGQTSVKFLGYIVENG